MTMPSVSVLLPVYNAIQDLPRALRSLSVQTLTDFEVIAIDDGSTDGSGEMLDDYARRDTRLRVYHQVNAGTLGKVLNRAAELAQGEYLARQDADDASDPTRLERQLRYLETKSQVGFCGTWVWFIEPALGPYLCHELPDDHRVIAGYLQKGFNPLTHGSVMMRAGLFRASGGYRGSFSEDLDLWLRLSEKTQVGMVKYVGYYYWRSIGGINTGADLRQQALNRFILKLHLERMSAGRELSEWASEYERISQSNQSETRSEERLAAVHYARALNLLRIGRWGEYRRELKHSASAEGPYAEKARRNLVLFWAAPLTRLAYRLVEMREPLAYARRFKPGTPLPEFLTKDSGRD
jgi:glycosyltransferase involved in cell wall biosynthesis